MPAVLDAQEYRERVNKVRRKARDLKMAGRATIAPLIHEKVITGTAGVMEESFFGSIADGTTAFQRDKTNVTTNGEAVPGQKKVWILGARVIFLSEGLTVAQRRLLDRICARGYLEVKVGAYTDRIPLSDLVAAAPSSIFADDLTAATTVHAQGRAGPHMALQAVQEIKDGFECKLYLDGTDASLDGISLTTRVEFEAIEVLK